MRLEEDIYRLTRLRVTAETRFRTSMQWARASGSPEIREEIITKARQYREDGIFYDGLIDPFREIPGFIFIKRIQRMDRILDIIRGGSKTQLIEEDPSQQPASAL